MFHSFFGFNQSCLLMQPANDSYLLYHDIKSHHSSQHLLQSRQHFNIKPFLQSFTRAILILYLIRKTEYPDIQHQTSIDKHKLYIKDGYCAGLKTQGESVLKPHFILIASRDSHLLWTSVSS